MTTQPNNNHTAENPVGRFMVAAGAVIELGTTGKILLTQRAASLDWHPNTWEMCYGRIDQGEDPETGLRREIQEELGLTDITINSILTTWHIYRGPEKPENGLVGITYACQTNQEEIVLSNEHQQYRWMTPEEALKLVKVEGITRDITQFIEYKQKAKLTPKIGRDCIGVGAGALIFNDQGKFLLTLRGKQAKNEVGTWEIPGGAIEFGETFKEGLQREIKEELDIEIEVQEMLELHDHILPAEEQHWVSPTYICRIVSGEPKIMEPEKCDQIGWFSVAEAQQLPLSVVTRQNITILTRA